jgi:hypothetical protein
LAVTTSWWAARTAQRHLGADRFRDQRGQRFDQSRHFSNPSGTNEGKLYLGSKSVVTNGKGIVSFTFVPPAKVPLGKAITATATDLSDDETAEFSARRSRSRYPKDG